MTNHQIVSVSGPSAVAPGQLAELDSDRQPPMAWSGGLRRCARCWSACDAWHRPTRPC